MAKKPNTRSDGASSGSNKAAVEQQMPGWKTVQQSSEYEAFTMDAETRRHVEADAVLPSIAELRQKYLGDAATVAPENADFVDLAAPDPTELVQVESAEQRKSIGVRNGKIVWKQG